MEEEKNISAVNNNKREDYLSWEEYFMAVAFLSAKRSKDPCSQVGACIVDEKNRIISVGYNGFPRGCDDNNFPWSKDNTDPLEQKYMYVVHAEANAILNKNLVNVDGMRMYVALFPCNECTKLIIQAGIKEIIYMSDKHAHKAHTIASKRMLDAVGITYRQFIPRQKRIIIDFNEIDWDKQNQLPSTPIKRKQ